VRARHMKTFVEALGDLGHDAQTRILGQLKVDDVKIIDESLPAIWLPIEVNVELTNATSSELGQEGAHAFYRRMVLTEYKTNTFKSFLATVNRLLGLSPATYVKMAPRGWELVFKKCGRFRSLDGDGHSARLEYSKIPRACMRSQLWIESVRSSFSTAFDISNVDGEIIWDDLDFVALRAVFLFRW
jgi:hypothetical protein